jgi:hypothetical protein
MNVIRRLADRGEVRTRELTNAARERAARSQRSRTELIRLVRKEVQRRRQTGGPEE